jgi:hypothetical protein
MVSLLGASESVPDDNSWPLVLAAGAIALIIAAALAVAMGLWRRRQPLRPERQIEFIDVAALPADGPPAGRRQLTCYGVPVRLAVVVVAPSGRGSDASGEVLLADVLEAAIPGLADIARDHAPRVDRWPVQVSAQGFMQAFFSHLRLPEDHGRGTPWTSAAGRVEHKGIHYLLGVVLCADRPNSLGEITIEHAGHWLDVLRLRE